MVKVSVVENRVKSHVGSVYETQKRTDGSTLRMERMTRPRRPKVEEETVSGGGVAATVTDVCSAWLADDMAVDEECQGEGAAMMAEEPCRAGEGKRASKSQQERELGMGRKRQGQVQQHDAHGVAFCRHVVELWWMLVTAP